MMAEFQSTCSNISLSSKCVYHLAGFWQLQLVLSPSLSGKLGSEKTKKHYFVGHTVVNARYHDRYLAGMKIMHKLALTAISLAHV